MAMNIYSPLKLNSHVDIANESIKKWKSLINAIVQNEEIEEAKKKS